MKRNAPKVLGILMAILVIHCLSSSCNVVTKNTSGNEDIINYNFNSNWAFFRGDVKDAETTDFNDKDWYAISIPHTMRLEKKHSGGGDNYQGIGWYRRYFRLPEAYKNKKIEVYFDGVQSNCDVFLNGEKLKSHYGGYIGFVVDLTNKIKFDTDNVLAVRVSNVDDPLTPPGKPLTGMDFNYYGGIYRNVKLRVTNKLYISDPLQANKVAGGGIFISYSKVSRQSADVNVKTHIINETNLKSNCRLLTLLKDSDGNIVAKAESSSNIERNADHVFEQSFTVTNPNLWHPDHPYLYSLVSEVYNDNQLSDTKNTNAGIRTFSFLSAEGEADGFYINGEKLYLRGANRHQCYQNIGDAASTSMQYRDAFQLKKGGYNSVRAAHYPASTEFLDACDEIGLLVIECEPGWQFFSDNETFIARTHEQVREMIRRDRNHPSIFLWEASLNESPSPGYWAKEIVQVAHQEMPGDQMFTADDFEAHGREFYDVSYKVTNPDGTDPMPEMPFITREWGDTWLANPDNEDGLRTSRIYTQKGLLAVCKIRQDNLNGNSYWDHGKLDANPRISGHFLWSYNDYPRGSDPITAFTGVVDIDRYEKHSYYQLQAMQDARNPVYGPMVYIASYNNYPQLDSAIIVFSNCDKVKFYRNNQFVQEITRCENAKTAPAIAEKGGSPYYKFNMESYEPGELKAEGIIDNKVVCKHIVKTPGKPHHLEIEIADEGILPIADGSDMIPYYIKVCDKNGTLVSNTLPFQSFLVQTSVSGQGELIGANIPRIQVASQQTKGGIGYGIVRTTNRPGEIVITAQSEGLKSAKATINSIASSDYFVPDGKHFNWKSEKEDVDFVEEKASSSELIRVPLSASMITISDNDDTESLEYLSDGSSKTIWKSKKREFPYSITFDLKKAYKLQGHTINWGKDSDWYTYSMDVSSNGNEWSSSFKNKKVSGQDYKPVLYNYKNIRYIRFSVIDVYPENSRLAIGDLEIYGNVNVE
ncbi:glycoside hydrolase family 2 TIM barrel-domain containing protein [Sunxiuqinia sp. A32]|uniref:glycoside hydrolase family 2 TIM barrel-domain containing protein n=1 Tax=Sunxiuqinia sp. A32 TaxID=3461496 RepID=UPI0040453B33